MALVCARPLARLRGLAATAFLLAASCSTGTSPCKGTGCVDRGGITQGADPTLQVRLPGYAMPDGRRFYRAGLPIQFVADTTGDIRSFDVIIDGDIVGCQVVGTPRVRRTMTSPPFVGFLDDGALEPGTHRLEAVAVNPSGRCKTVSLALYVDRVFESGVLAASVAPDGRSVAFLADGGAGPMLRRAPVAGGISRALLSDAVPHDVAAADFRFAEIGDRLAFLANRSGAGELYVDQDPKAVLVDTGVRDFVLSPDGASVAYVGRNGQAYLARYRQDRWPLGPWPVAGADGLRFADDAKVVLTHSVNEDMWGHLSAFDAVSNGLLFDVDRVGRFWAARHGALVVFERNTPDGVVLEWRSLVALGGVAQGPAGAGAAGGVLANGAAGASVDVAEDGSVVAFAVAGVAHVHRFGMGPADVRVAAPDLAGADAVRLGVGATQVLVARRPEGQGPMLSLVRIDPGALTLIDTLTGLAGEADLGRARFSASGAVAWRDGDRLFVSSGGAFRLVATRVADDFAFAPGGDRLAFRQDRQGSATLDVLGLAAQDVVVLPARASVGAFQWSAAGELAVVDGDPSACLPGAPCVGALSLWSRAGGEAGSFAESRTISAAARLVGFAPDAGAVVAIGRGVGDGVDAVLVTGLR